MKGKRFLAYAIDFGIVCLIIGIFSLLFQNTNIDHLQVEMNTLNEKFLNKNIDFIAYLNYYSIILHDLDKQKLLINIISALIIIGYYIFIPYKNKGRTLGKMIMNLQIYKEEGLRINDLTLRCVIINGLLYLLLNILLVMILPSFSYFLTISFLGILQIILVFTSAFMILYKEGKGLEDILTSSSVRIYKEVKK